MKRKVGKIKKELVFDLLQQAYDLGTREVGFYATGEPFLVPHGQLKGKGYWLYLMCI